MIESGWSSGLVISFIDRTRAVIDLGSSEEALRLNDQPISEMFESFVSWEMTMGERSDCEVQKKNSAAKNFFSRKN